MGAVGLVSDRRFWPTSQTLREAERRRGCLDWELYRAVHGSGKNSWTGSGRVGSAGGSGRPHKPLGRPNEDGVAWIRNFTGLFMGRVKTHGPGRVGSGRVRVTRPDPCEFLNTSYPDPSQADPTRPDPRDLKTNPDRIGDPSRDIKNIYK